MTESQYCILCEKLAKERDEALAKWSHWEKQTLLVAEQRDEARAEAAALREALTDVENWMGHAEDCKVDEFDNGCDCSYEIVKDALRQPGPGAAHQERVRKLEAALTRFATLDCGDNSCYFVEHRTGQRTNGGCRCFSDAFPRGPRQPFLAIKAEALAALEETP